LERRIKLEFHGARITCDGVCSPTANRMRMEAEHALVSTLATTLQRPGWGCYTKYYLP